MGENQLQWYNDRLKEYFTAEEIKTLMKRSNQRAAIEIIEMWLWILLAFAIVAIWPNAISIIIALFILGGKQLACAILMHDCSHDSMFTSRKANLIVGNCLGAYPILHNLEQYRPYHREHHLFTGLENDPDLSLTKGYPTTAISMTRKLIRDILGASGIKAVIGVLAMHLGFIRYNLGGCIIRITEKKNWKNWLNSTMRNLAGPVCANLILFGILWLCGHPLLYLLWPIALLTTYNFSLRVRSVAEHSVVEEQCNPQKNTRTTYANFFERMLFAPFHVNYHCEHHLCMGVPSYNLPAMHKILLQKGFYQKGVLNNNYTEIINLAISGRKA